MRGVLGLSETWPTDGPGDGDVQWRWSRCGGAREVVAVYRCEHDVVDTPLCDGVRSVPRLLLIGRFRLAVRLHRAKFASTRARVTCESSREAATTAARVRAHVQVQYVHPQARAGAIDLGGDQPGRGHATRCSRAVERVEARTEEHDGGRASIPALADVGTLSLLTDSCQPGALLIQRLFELSEARMLPTRCWHMEPRRSPTLRHRAADLGCEGLLLAQRTEVAQRPEVRVDLLFRHRFRHGLWSRVHDERAAQPMRRQRQRLTR